MSDRPGVSPEGLRPETLGMVLQLLLVVCVFLQQTCAVSVTHRYASPSPGYIMSYGWPMNYPHNYKAVWTLESFDSNYRVQAQVVATHIEHDSRCRWDYVQVFDGDSENSPTVGRFCGFSRPLLVSSNQSLTLSFTTDSSRSYSGFKIKFWCSPKPGALTLSPYSERNNIIAAALAAMMSVTVSYIVIITCCRGAYGRSRHALEKEEMMDRLIGTHVNDKLIVVDIEQ